MSETRDESRRAPQIVVWGDSSAIMWGPFAQPPPGLPENESGASYTYADTEERLQAAIKNADIVFAWNFFSNPTMQAAVEQIPFWRLFPHRKNATWRNIQS